MEEGPREARDIGRYVRARREATAPTAYSELPNRRRHVQHLTQSDLADLTRISTVVISQIEQGRYPNLNHAILHRIAQTLKLTTQQETYLLGLFEPRAANQKALDPAPDWVHTFITSIEHPVVVVNPAYDIVCVNDPGKALNPNFEANRNSATMVFRHPPMREFFVDWLPYVSSVVSGLRMSYAMFPDYRDYIDSIAKQLEATDQIFNDLWNKDDPLVKPTFEKQLNHPELGMLNVLQILTDIVEAPSLTRVEFIPADAETREKFERL